MRHERQPLVPVQDAADFRFSFQMTNCGARHGCTVIIRARNKAGAKALFRENWSTIEKLTRETMLNNAERLIKLELR
jgi:hypothetical protein